MLLANEPRTYREVLVHALRAIRPRVEVGTVDPEDIDDEIVRLRPHLVVCSRGRAALREGVLTWVMLYPDGENRAEVVTAGGRAMLVGLRFDDFLSIVDGTELAHRFEEERAKGMRR